MEQKTLLKNKKNQGNGGETMAKRDDSVKKKVPELRFKGFTDDWEERKFSDIVVRLNKSSNNNQLPKVEFEDIIAGEGRLNKDISRKFDDRKGTLFEPDNILYGKLRPYLKNWLFSDFKGIALGDFWVFKSINSEPKFVYSLIQADNYQRVANDTSGTKMPRSDWKKVSSSNFSIPTSLEEQQKIGSFFKQLDETIALHQRKLDLLKEQKKGFLQKMFPKNGEKVPELRFAGFADDWEQRKFEEIWKRTSDKNKDLRFKPTDILSVAKMKYSDSPKNSTDEYMKTYFILKKGDIAFEGNKSKDYSFGRFVLNDVADGIVSHVFITFEPIAPMDINFMKIYINNEEVMKHKLVKSTTKTLMMTTLNVKDINRQMLPIPNLEEQQKIGTFFKSLDNTIALHQRKLDLLKEQKKGFLQKMFV